MRGIIKWRGTPCQKSLDLLRGQKRYVNFCFFEWLPFDPSFFGIGNFRKIEDMSTLLLEIVMGLLVSIRFCVRVPCFQAGIWGLSSHPSPHHHKHASDGTRTPMQFNKKKEKFIHHQNPGPSGNKSIWCADWLFWVLVQGWQWRFGNQDSKVVWLSELWWSLIPDAIS